MIIQHRAGKKHINADGLSRIPDDIEACRNYRPDVNLEELPCGGCKFCTRARQQWQTFEEEVDFVVPLTIRRLVDDGSYNTNWTPSYSPVELHEEQMKDSDLKTLKRWIEDKYEPTKAELKLCSEVVRHFWSLRQQIQIKDNILLYKWEDPISPRLLFMTPKQMQKELLHGCHDVVSSGHMGQYKTLEKLKQIAVWLNMTQSCKLYVKSCTTCNLNKKSTRTARSKLGQYHAGFPMERVHMDILGPLPVTKTE
ncbi:Hypothetical predicted protein, partial [Mytilus galloprovincialis]